MTIRFRVKLKLMRKEGCRLYLQPFLWDTVKCDDSVFLREPLLEGVWRSKQGLADMLRV